VSESLKKLDRQIYQAERAIVVAALVVMAVVVFLDVVHRTFSGEASKLAGAVAKISGMFGAPLPEDGEGFAKLSAAAPYISIVASFGLGYLGVRTSKRDEPVPPARAAVMAAVGLVVVYGLIRLLLVLLPNGLVWSQPLALLLTLWVGFVGASMCTYENKHLKVEAVQRFLPPRFKPAVGFVSGLMTALVCAGLMWVSLRYVMFNYEEYVATDGKGGLFLGMDIPKYLGFVALPVSFGIMAARFFAVGLAALRGDLPEDDPTGGLLEGRGVKAPNAGSDGDRLPSDVETEAMLVEGQPRPSEVDTVSSRRERVGRPAPSQINTQPHELLDSERAEAQPSAAGTLGQRAADEEEAADEAEAEGDAAEPDAPSAAAATADLETDPPDEDAAEPKPKPKRSFAPPARPTGDDEGDDR
jgi:TRAP-type C4-dicarboxylate transport system permease small subunit